MIILKKILICIISSIKIAAQTIDKKAKVC